MLPHLASGPLAARQGYAPVENARLFYRDHGQGQPILILHGGPDFDHRYLRPDMDRLSDSFRLVYYDQRGRGQSAEGVRLEEVTLESEIDDLKSLRQYFQLDAVAILGHSWGGLLAMEYALRHPGRASHLILMNTAPASHADFMLFQRERRQRAAGDLEKLQALRATARYAAGDLETEAEYYRLHFRTTLRRPELLERVIGSLRVNFTPQGIRTARAIENRLYDQTWLLSDYDLLPRLKQFRIPTLILHGDYDFIPRECAAHIANAIPGARLIVLHDCGHFAYLECPDQVRAEATRFFNDH